MATDVLAAMHENDHLSQLQIEQRINKWKRLLADYDYRKNEGYKIHKVSESFVK